MSLTYLNDVNFDKDSKVISLIKERDEAKIAGLLASVKYATYGQALFYATDLFELSLPDKEPERTLSSHAFLVGSVAVCSAFAHSDLDPRQIIRILHRLEQEHIDKLIDQSGLEDELPIDTMVRVALNSLHDNGALFDIGNVLASIYNRGDSVSVIQNVRYGLGFGAAALDYAYSQWVDEEIIQAIT